MLKNTTTTFGTITKCLHWLIFLLLSTQLSLTWLLATAIPGSPTQSQYVFLHKSVGVTIFIVAVLFIFWKIVSPSPQPVDSDPHWKHIIAKMVHYAMLLLIMIMPLIGYFLSCSDGYIVDYFGWFILPCLVGKNEAMGSLLYTTHVILGFTLFALISLHILAALQHHFILKDKVLKRMLPFYKSDVDPDQ